MAVPESIEPLIRGRMASFAEAEKRLDAEGVLSHFDPGPETTIYNDGQRLSFTELAEGLTTTFQSLRSIQGIYDRMEIRLLADDYAMVVVEFREQVVDVTGEASASQGVATWLWRRFDLEWRIVYGQAEHYPDTPTVSASR